MKKRDTFEEDILAAYEKGEPKSVAPPRQNSCRLDMILNLEAIRKSDGKTWRSIQEPGRSAVVANGEHRCGAGAAGAGEGRCR